MSKILPAMLVLALAWHAKGEAVEHIEVTHDGVTVRASVAPAGATLAITGQVFPAANPRRPAENDANTQVAACVARLDELLSAAGASRDSLVRVNLYAATPKAAMEAERALHGEVKCSIAMVVSALPKPGALVALDAVAVATAETSTDANVRLLKSDRAVYISGMAAEGEMGTATRLTLEKLDEVLKHFGLTRADVVHVKSFLQGADDVSASRAELEKFFDGKPPPHAWVEWTMKDPIEIEMVAQAKSAPDESVDTVAFHTPPGAKASPLYSRVATVHGGRTIYASLLAEHGHTGDAIAETRRILAAFREVITKAGGDFEHLVKATYYPATDATSAALNQVRPLFYNPERPPAASKAPARGTGVDRADITLDLIAVTPSTAAAAAAAAKLKTISLAQFDSMRDGGDVVVLDVRTPEEFAEGHVPGATNLDVRDPAFAERVAKLGKTKTYLVYCRSGRRSATAGDQMCSVGFAKVYNFTGSMNEWNAAKKPVEKSPPAKAE